MSITYPILIWNAVLLCVGLCYFFTSDLVGDKMATTYLQLIQYAMGLYKDVYYLSKTDLVGYKSVQEDYHLSTTDLVGYEPVSGCPSFI